MSGLAYDYHRCQASEPDGYCKTCRRWADLPGQTWGPRTPCVDRTNSTDENCSYIPIMEKKNDHHEN